MFRGIGHGSLLAQQAVCITRILDSFGSIALARLERFCVCAASTRV
jgi:hypothetical protein